MSYDWPEFLALAKELAADGNPKNREARLRTVVSRAYYAAFGTARTFLAAEDTVCPSKDPHQFVKNEFFRTGADQARREIGIELGLTVCGPTMTSPRFEARPPPPRPHALPPRG